MMVVVYHIALYKNIHPSNAVQGWLVNHAYLAVDLFFVISGFVISYAFDERITGGLSFSSFMKLRVFRLYPMIAVGLGLGVFTLIGVHLAYPSIPAWRFLVAAGMNAILLPTTTLTAGKSYLFPINSVFWSLSFEMVMYALYFATIRRMNGIVLVVFVALMAAAVGVACYFNNGLNVGFDTKNYLWGFARVTFSFFAGVLIKRRLMNIKTVHNLCYLAAPLLILILINPVAASGVYDFITVVLALPFIAFLATLAGEHIKLNQISKTLGEISYPLYAIHLPLVLIFTHLTAKIHLPPSADFGLTLTFIIGLVTTAYYLNRLYDAPVRLRLSKLNLGF